VIRALSFILCLVALMGAPATRAQEPGTADHFERTLAEMGLVFQPPSDFQRTEPQENGQMNWERSYRHPTAHFEVRYALRPHTHGFFEPILRMTSLNISGGQEREPSWFHPEDVMEEFGADVGAAVGLPTGAEFAFGYAACLMVYLHERGVGDAFIFYMADDLGSVPPLMEPLFHALRFE
jgi:hypothetical protein